MIEVLNAWDPAHYARWESLVDASPHPDVYYRPGYARAYEEVERARACALVVCCGASKALLPFLVRESSIGGECVRDAFSPYGYGGFCLLDGPEPPDRTQVCAMLQQVQEWCRAEQIVTCVIRLHPLLCQAEFLGAIGSEDLMLRATRSVPTIALDLRSDWNDSLDCPGSMHPRRRTYFNAAARCLESRLVPAGAPGADTALTDFRSLYDQTMERLNADAFLRFPATYYSSLAAGLRDRLQVAIARHNGHPAGGVLFMAEREFAHYHLSGTNADGRKHRATTLLIVEAARWARRRGCRRLHLGGGVAPNDSLFHFKQSFGGSLEQYRALMLIAEPQRWAKLRQTPGASWPYSIE